LGEGKGGGGFRGRGGEGNFGKREKEGMRGRETRSGIWKRERREGGDSGEGKELALNSIVTRVRARKSSSDRIASML
jgi:hypothetical protein